MPPPRNIEEELSDEPWFGVSDGDIFPEELSRFLGLQDRLRELFERHHGDLFTVEFWRGMQARLARGEVIEILPYSPASRLSGV
jgi:isocitrate dehydrogenase kinase/phosphatase